MQKKGQNWFSFFYYLHPHHHNQQFPRNTLTYFLRYAISHWQSSYFSFSFKKVLDRGTDPKFCTHTAFARNFYNIFWEKHKWKLASLSNHNVLFSLHRKLEYHELLFCQRQFESCFDWKVFCCFYGGSKRHIGKCESIVMIECTYGTAAHKSNQIKPECKITFETNWWKRSLHYCY